MELQINEEDGGISGFDKEDETRVAVAIAIATFHIAKVAPLAGHTGEYKSQLTPSLAKELIEESSFNDLIFFLDYAFGKKIGVGLKRQRQQKGNQEEENLILVDRGDEPIPVKKVKLIIEEANYQLSFEDEGDDDD